ncbi:MAG TPA: SpoIIE family protein phosphatase [Phycisphaerales bacterium]|nr:SpoIIE family protein phosphatase [Phycisphaerales bacterium]
MLFSIRWKLIAAIGVPLTVLLVGGGVYDYFRLREAAFQATAERMTEVAGRLASDLDSEFQRVAQVSISAAKTLEAFPEMSERDLYDLAALNVSGNCLIYGSCISFEPGGFRGARAAPGELTIPEAEGDKPKPNPDLFCPYVYRAPDDSFVRMDVADAYDYLEEEWKWYSVPRTTGRPYWTEPFFDTGAGNVAMVTYVAPFFENGVFRGTVNTDIHLERLEEHALRGFKTPTQVLILSREGRFIRPLVLFEQEHTPFTLAKTLNDPGIAEIGRAMLRGERGAGRFAHPDGSADWGFYAPIESTGWSVLGAIDEYEIMAPVYKHLQTRTMLGAGIVVLVLGIVVVMGTWIVRPVQRLAEDVERLRRGELLGGEGEAACGHPKRRGHDEIGRLARAFDGMVVELRQHIAALTQETAAREAVETELKVARQIQAALLPRVFPSRDDLGLHASSTPAKLVGGDFFDFFFTEKETMHLVIADVSGKGIPAAIFMAVTRTLLRDLLMRGAGPAEALEEANRALIADNESGMFVTVWVGRYTPASGEFVYADAGHPVPLTVRSDGTVARFGEVTGTVLGAVDGMKYEERTQMLGRGETLVFFTDGVSEARTPGGQFFGEDGLAGILNEHGRLQPRELCERIVRHVDDFQAQNPADDLTLVILQRRA